LPGYSIFTGEQTENTLFRPCFKAQDSGFPRRRFTPNFFDIQKASVFTNPPKSGGCDVVEDLCEGLPAQGEKDFFETSILSLAGSEKKKRTTPFHAARWCEAHAAPRQKNAKRSRYGLTMMQVRAFPTSKSAKRLASVY
jgi:hypothetical protein